MQDQLIPLLYRADQVAVDKRIPYSVIFEVTRHCNLDCRMCYVVGHESADPEELSTDEAKHVLDQLAQAGTLRLSFSGGEPFLRADLLELIAYAKQLAFSVDIMTNGILIGPETAKRLKKLVVWQVSISLLGATPETHDSITGRKGSFTRALNALKLLREEGVRARIKTLIMKQNFHEYKQIIDLAKDLGVPFSMDPTVSSRNDGDTDTLSMNLTDDQFKELLANPSLGPRTLSLNGDELEANRKVRLDGYLCKAGISFCDISWNGDVRPCMQYPESAGNLREDSFADIWNESPLFEKLRNARRTHLPDCKDCALLPLCFRCPATALLEKGDPFAAYETACHRAALMEEVRFARIEEASIGS